MENTNLTAARQGQRQSPHDLSDVAKDQAKEAFARSARHSLGWIEEVPVASAVLHFGQSAAGFLRRPMIPPQPSGEALEAVIRFGMPPSYTSFRHSGSSDITSCCCDGVNHSGHHRHPNTTSKAFIFSFQHGPHKPEIFRQATHQTRYKPIADILTW
jgi:hypothetical protein